MNPKISIIIVNYKTLQLTLQCLDSIFSNVKDKENFVEIIVVDNASEDDTIHQLRQKYPKVICVQSNENLGFGRANNLGATYAQGDYLFFLNSDTLLHNNPFDYFFDFINNNQDQQIGTLGAAFLMDKSNNYAQSGGTFYSAKKYLYNAARRWVLLDHKQEIDITSTTNLPVDYVIGADLWIKHSLFKEIGGFDPRIFLYFEDVELCKRLKKKGYQSFLIQGPKIQHLIKSSSTSQNVRIYNIASLMYCLNKEMNKLKFNLFRLSYFCLKLPVLLKRDNSFTENVNYLLTIFKYKNYLVSK